MHKTTRLAITALMLAFCANMRPATADWLLAFDCTTDLAVGFNFDESSRAWQPTTFRDRNRYIVRTLSEAEQNSRFLPDSGKHAWGVFEGDNEFPTYRCDEVGGYMFCDRQAMGNFQFDMQSLRFQKYYAFGYVGGRDSNEDTPAIEIGRCKQRKDK
jgi:hypothetical protein